MRLIYVIAALLVFSVHSYAKTSLSSMCYLVDKTGTQVQGDRSKELFELASVSKVITSYWAIQQLGPNYRFKTRVHVTPVQNGVFDVHIQGSHDPFWGRQLAHFLFSELNRYNVKQIRNMTFDENFTFRWSVVTDFINPLNPTTDVLMKALRNHVTALQKEYTRTRLEASSIGIKLPKTISLKVANIEYMPSAQFAAKPDTSSYVMTSAPLHQYLKEMNNTSNNHVADRLFDILGGPQKFAAFLEKDSNFEAKDIHFVNGSGNSMVVGKKANGAEIKEYNRGSCETTVRIVMKLDALLKKQGMSLKDVVAVSGTDASTLRPRYDALQNSLVAKTGTVDPQITLAGMVSTAQGDVYFGVFMDTTGPADWGTARARIRTKVFELVQKFGGKRSFTYASRPFMPFDAKSFFMTEGPTPDARP